MNTQNTQNTQNQVLTVIYCENREQFYSFTNDNNVTKWTTKISEAFYFDTKQEAKNLIKEFKKSAMNDTKYISIV
tara:strand:- start:4119 stop:4343 length:225 start_codon:yes stop_codon:yes gene_type:complete